MKVLLLLPKANIPVADYHLLPMGLAYIAASLKSVGAEVKYIDLETDKQGKEKLSLVLREWKPHYIGFSIIPRYVDNALKLAKEFKSKRCDAKLVAGGIHPSVAPELFLEDDSFDYVIRGDGEIPFKSLIRKDSLNEISGLCFKDSYTSEIIDNGVNYEPFNLEELPFPDFETIPLNKYPTPPLGIFLKLPSYPMFATRGCGGKCTFCTNYDFNKKHRVRAAENVIQEILMAVAKYKAKEIYFMDANFSFNMEYTYQLCEALLDRKLPVTWHCGTRIDKVDEKLLDIMKAAGCCSVAFALETADQTMAKKIQKPYNLERAVEIFKYCDKLGLFIKHNFMYGLPGETEKSLKKTLSLALSVPADIAYFHMFNLQLMLKNEARTPIEEEYKRLKQEKKGKDIAALFPLVSEKKIKWHFFKSYLWFYLRPSFWWRTFSRRVNRICFYYNFIQLLPLLFYAVPKIILLSGKFMFSSIKNQSDVREK